MENQNFLAFAVLVGCCRRMDAGARLVAGKFSGRRGFSAATGAGAGGNYLPLAKNKNAK